MVPTGPKGETTPFCHWRLDYLDIHPNAIADTFMDLYDRDIVRALDVG